MNTTIALKQSAKNYGKYLQQVSVHTIANISNK
jgi:hypothetical protein